MDSKKTTPYTAAELEQLRLMFAQGRTDEEMSRALCRSMESIMRHRYRLGLKRPGACERSVEQGHRWTEEETQFVRNYWREKSDRWMAAKLGVPVGVYRRKRRSLEYCAPDGQKRRCLKSRYRQKGMRRTWRFAEEQYLIDHYAALTAEEIARRLGKKPHSVRNKVAYLGLRKVSRKTDAPRAATA